MEAESDTARERHHELNTLPHHPLKLHHHARMLLEDLTAGKKPHDSTAIPTGDTVSSKAMAFFEQTGVRWLTKPLRAAAMRRATQQVLPTG